MNINEEGKRLDTVAVGFGSFFALIGAAVLVDRAGWFDVAIGTVVAVALLAAGTVLVAGSLKRRQSSE
jgi:hypothetical protein